MNETTDRLQLAPQPSSLAVVRRWFRERLGRLDESLLAQVILVANEVVSNVIKHGGVDQDGHVTLSVRVGTSVVRVEVVYPGVGFDPDESPPGWGLYLMSRVASRWGVEARPDARCVWFEIDGDGLRTR